jgi:nitrite reductase/ring-hydroxylating ferredoxin subunit
MTEIAEIEVGKLEELADPGCREFEIGGGDWPFRGFVVRQGNNVFIDTGLCFRGPCVGKSLRQVEVDVRDGVVYVTGPMSM